MVSKTSHRHCSANLELKPAQHSTRRREAETQTALLVPRPPKVVVPPIVEPVHAETQLDSGELFNFDTDAEPTLQKLIGSTVDTAIRELTRESELDSLDREREAFEKVCSDRRADLLRLEQDESRKRDELNDRISQEKVKLAVSKSALSKALSLKLANEVIAEASVETIAVIVQDSEYRNSLRSFIEKAYLPSVFVEAHEQYASNPQSLERYIRESFVPGVIHDAISRVAISI